MSKGVYLLFVICLVKYSTCQLDGTGLFRVGLRWFGQENVDKKNLQKVEEEIFENSVHGEKILESPTHFVASAAKRIFGIIPEAESQIVDRHHKRTNLIEVAKNLNLTTFISKAKESGIDDVLDHEGKFTVFAPTNEAFERIPKFCSNLKLKDLMKYHVSKGAVPSSHFKNNLILRTLLTRRGNRINVYQNNSVVTANGRRINQTDFKASNGILHVIDDVMCAIYRGGAAFAINRCPNMTVLSKALNLTNLYSTLEKAKEVTVFAPSDSAFAKIPQEVLDSLLNNVTALTDVLLYHVVADIWYSPGLEDGQVLTTLQGQNITIGISENVTVNDATVIAADATVKNGVVHGIDSVLLPSSIQESLKYKPDPVVLIV